jgi:hypothetical protein
MYIYKLRYNDRATAITDLIAKGVIDTNEKNTSITQSAVELGILLLTSGTYDAEFNEITAPIYADGYHFDVMLNKEIDFGEVEIKTKNPKHAFLGFNTNQI